MRKLQVLVCSCSMAFSLFVASQPLASAAYAQVIPSTNSCSNLYGYAEVGYGSFSIQNGQAALEVFLMQKYYYDAQGKYHPCHQYHTDTYACPNTGYTIQAGEVATSIYNASTGVGGIGYNIASYGTRTSCDVVSSYDTINNNPASPRYVPIGSTIIGYGAFDEGGTPLYAVPTTSYTA